MLSLRVILRLLIGLVFVIAATNLYLYPRIDVVSDLLLYFSVILTSFIWLFCTRSLDGIFIVIITLNILLLPFSLAYVIDPNNLLRLIWYAMLISVVKQFYSVSSRQFLIKISLFLIVLLSCEEIVFLEFLNNGIYSYEGMPRLSVTLMDSNYYSFFLVIALGVSKFKSRLFHVVVTLIIALLILYSGSRMGVLLVLLYMISFFEIKRIFSFQSLVLISLFLVSSFFFFRVGFTAIERLVNPSVKDLASVAQRLELMKWSLSYNGNLQNLIFPKGSLGYISSWREFTGLHHFVHNQYLYSLGEYGIYSLVVFYIYFKKLFVLSHKISWSMLIGFFFLPNILYYFTSWFVLAYATYSSNTKK